MSAPEVGAVLPEQAFRVTRATLVAYAGASGDTNPIHWSERVARSAGLPGVIAHGMLTMALAGRVVTAFAGDPGRVESYGVRFAHPVPVPDDDDGTTLTVRGTVEEVLDGGRVRVSLRATVADGVKVLLGASAVVRLP